MSGIIAQNSGRHTGLVKAASAGGEWTLIQTQTASGDSTISFTSGIDSTYDEYCFRFISIHPETDNVEFQFNMSTDGGSNYNVTKTTTFFTAYQKEDGSGGTLEYNAGGDLAQSTAVQKLTVDVDNANARTT